MSLTGKHVLNGESQRTESKPSKYFPLLNFPLLLGYLKKLLWMNGGALANPAAMAREEEATPEEAENAIWRGGDGTFAL
jgi:hypothetical protein